MIFVTVGTTSFDELISTMDQLAPTLSCPVVMQIGSGSVIPAHASAWFRFAPSLEDWLRCAGLVVSHGGSGTLVEVLRRGRRLVGVSNPVLYDRHQDDLLAEFENAGYLIWCRDLARLDDAIRQAEQAIFRSYSSTPCTLHQEIAAMLADSAKPRRYKRLRHLLFETGPRRLSRFPDG
jgi:beta-1,4-N-acetylglucosaminyltransferase